MLDQEITEDLKIFTQKIMEIEGIPQYEINIEGQTKKGINFASEIIFFTVISKTDERKFNLVMKTSRRSEAKRKAAADSVGDVREMYLYSKVFPTFRQMLSESGSDYQLENITKTFLVNMDYRHETTIMQDLRALGYTLLDTHKPINLEHIETVLKYYGKFHAASMALRSKNPQVFADLTEDMDNIFKYFIGNPVMKMLGDYVQDALNILSDVRMEEIVEQLKDVPEKVAHLLAKDLDDGDKIAVTHGDCWINNLMFKYENQDTSKPSGVCFLDFQVSTFGSPASDLSYFLYASCDEATISTKFDHLLHIYYESLASTLRTIGLNPDVIFTYQTLKEHWRKYAITGLIMASTVIKIQLMKKDEVPDLSNEEKGTDWVALKVGDMENNDIYRRRIIAVYKHYAETCLT